MLPIKGSVCFIFDMEISRAQIIVIQIANLSFRQYRAQHSTWS